ncbi:hypothetical protein P0Y35_17475 [Kiritimatiellaeota bacterium B1221]|nr:hypothetical protein [Kiritimatiellaeota bacterium B1221]
MPATFTLMPERKWVYTKVYGPVTEKDFMSHVENITAHFQTNHLDETWKQLIFLDDVAYVGKDVVSLIRHLVLINPWPVTCTRVIVSKNKYFFGLARIYQQLADPEQQGIEVVSTLDEAEIILMAE